MRLVPTRTRHYELWYGEGFEAGMKASMGRGDLARGYSGVIGGIYRVAGPPGFEPGTFGSAGRRSSPG
jgi:hypothetical protein